MKKILDNILHAISELFNRENTEEDITICNKSEEIIKIIQNKLEEDKKRSINERQQKYKTLKLSVKQKERLEKLANGRCTALHLKQRANIILQLEKTSNLSSVSNIVNVSRQTVSLWKNRWEENQAELKRIEKSEPWKLKSSIITTLNDAYRSGSKPKFNMVQAAHIIYLSLQTPESLGVPISNWTPSALAKKAKELKIVDEISARQVGRYLEQLDINVHQYKGWLNSKDKIKDPQEFEKRAGKVCELYKNSKELEKQEIHLLSTDEKTGIQALEHRYPIKSVKPGEVEKVEYEYIRHGTTTLIVSRNVTTGKIVAPMLNETRTEKDFVQHISDVVALAPEDGYIFIMDQLNTHQSEELVRYIARECKIEDDLGKKNKFGILKSMESRKKFLEDETHRIRIVYTPRHCSWLNQVEIWFSILGRMLLNKRASFESVKALKNKIKEFIEYYNTHLAKAFKWTYSGKILQK